MPVLESYETERESRDLKAMFTGIALVGIIMFVLGLINPTRLDLWGAGLGLVITGAVAWLVNRITNRWTQQSQGEQDSKGLENKLRQNNANSWLLKP